MRAVDSTGVAYLSQTSVLLQDIVEQRGVLCDTYGYLEDRLTAGDTLGASMISAGKYQSIIGLLWPNLPAAASMLGTIADGVIRLGSAELTVVRDNDDQTRDGFPLRMTLGVDGVWRISEM